MKAHLLLVVIASCVTTLLAFTDNIDNSGIKFDSREVKCLVCRSTVAEMQKAIGKVDPRKRVEVSGFRIDSQGNTITKSVQLSKSETYLTELSEEICETMDDYVKARFKKSKKLTIMKLMTDSGMNPLMSSVDFVQDGDLNKSLKHFCLEVLEDNDEAVMEAFTREQVSETIADDLCQVEAKYCDHAGDVQPSADDLAEPTDFPEGAFGGEEPEEPFDEEDATEEGAEDVAEEVAETSDEADQRDEL